MSFVAHQGVAAVQDQMGHGWHEEPWTAPADLALLDVNVTGVTMRLGLSATNDVAAFNLDEMALD